MAEVDVVVLNQLNNSMFLTFLSFRVATLEFQNIGQLFSVAFHSASYVFGNLVICV